MDTTKFTMGIVGLVVIILMVTGAVLPAVENAQTDLYKSELNTDYRYQMNAASSGVTVTMSGGVPYINGESLIAFVDPELTTNTVFFIISDVAILVSTYYPATGTWSTTVATFFTFPDEGYNPVVTIGVNDSVSFADGTLTITRPTSTPSSYTHAYSWVMTPSTSGDYAAYAVADLASKDCYVDDEKTLYVIGHNGIQSAFLAKGTLEEMDVVFNIVSQQILDNDAFLTIGTEKEFNDATNKINTVAKGADSPPITTPTYIVVPIEYSVLEDSDSTFVALFGIIPLLLIIVAVLYAVRLMGASRN